MTKSKKDICSNERKTADLQPVARTVMPLARALLGRRGLVEIDLMAAWEQIVGADLAEFTRPLSLESKAGGAGGVLTVAVPSGAFALELQHREKALLGKVNGYFGYPAAARMKIIQSQVFESEEVVPAKEDRPQKTLVTKQEENYIDELSAEINHPDLQEMLKKLGRSVFNSNKGGNQEDEV